MENSRGKYAKIEIVVKFFKKIEYENSIFYPPGGSQEVSGGFEKLRGTGTNHLHLVSADFHGG